MPLAGRVIRLALGRCLLGGVSAVGTKRQFDDALHEAAPDSVRARMLGGVGLGD